MPLEPMPPFDPSVATGGAATNLVAGASAGMSQAPTEEPVIFAGWTKVTSKTGHPTQPRTTESREPTYLTLSEFMSRFDSASRKEFLQLRNLLVAGGVVAPGANPYTVRNAFQSVLGAVANMTASGVHVSPMGYVKNLIRMNGIDPADVTAAENWGADPPGGAGTPFTGTKTQVNRTISDVTEGEAWSMMRQTLSQTLGRDPSDDEVRDFAFKMNQLAAESPSISTTIARFREGDMVSSNTETEDGFTADDMAKRAYEDAQSDPEYAEYQASTTYYNAALSALGAIGQT